MTQSLISSRADFSEVLLRGLPRIFMRRVFI
jgi:hypothetical protein